MLIRTFAFSVSEPKWPNAYAHLTHNLNQPLSSTTTTPSSEIIFYRVPSIFFGQETQGTVSWLVEKVRQHVSFTRLNFGCTMQNCLSCTDRSFDTGD